MRPRIAGLLTAALCALLGLAIFWYGQSRARPADAAPTRVATARVAPDSGSPPAPAAVPIVVPERGDGRFTVAPGTAGPIGTGKRLVRFRVMVEGGAGVDPPAFAAVVEQTLADPRSWIASGKYKFQRVSSGPTDLYVHLATPGTTDTECARRYVQTKGEVSCRGGDDVFINLKRWQLAIPAYAAAVDEYRHYVVNHEIGHFLGNGHVRCPVPGGPAPVMQTQSLDMTGCQPNAWPYPDGHRLFTGPVATS